MCGGPEAPEPSREQILAEKEAAYMRQQQLQEQNDQRSENKKWRFEQALKQLSGNSGRQSLITGGRGGAGFAAPMAISLLARTQ